MKASPWFVACAFALAGFAPSLSAENVVVRVTDTQGAPVTNAQVVAILKSGAYQDAKLDAGDYKCQPAEECVKIFAAAPGFEGAVKRYDGKAGTCAVTMKASAEKSSAISHDHTRLGSIDGTVNPMLDGFKRTYMYSKGINFTQRGKAAAQPIHFELNKPVDAVTPTGQKFQIWVREITPQIALLEFTAPK